MHLEKKLGESKGVGSHLEHILHQHHNDVWLLLCGGASQPSQIAVINEIKYYYHHC